jgi:putative endopeptidase
MKNLRLEYLLNNGTLMKHLIKLLYVLVITSICTIAYAQSSTVSLIDPNAIDHSVSPCDDFYQYACGNWIKNTKLPPSQPVWDRGFISVLPDKISKELQGILHSYSQGNFIPFVSYAEKMGNFYSSCMNEALIEKVSADAIIKQLTTIDKIRNLSDIPSVTAELQLKHVNVFFNLDSTADLLHPIMQIGELSQGGMGLPNGTYYIGKDSSTLATLKKYQEYGEQLFELAGYSKSAATANMKIVISIETQLAKAALPPQEIHEIAKLYHPMTLAQLQALSKNFNWYNYFHALSIPIPTTVNVTEPNFIVAMNTIIRQSSLSELKLYLKWRLLQTLAPYLNSQYVNAYFEFEQKYLKGQQVIAPRAERCEQVIDNSMGDALGHAYVKKYFDPKAKKIALAMMKNIMNAFEVDLRKSDWLDEKTRQAALKKLHLMKVRVGYPDRWRSYEGLIIDKSSFLNNALNAAKFNKKWELEKIGHKTNPNEYLKTPQTVDMSYIPTTNSIEILAAILQPPYFSENATLAENYGGIGMGMGHELIHGFDSSGRRFDGYGRLKDWWSKTTEKKYLAKIQCLSNQYSQYEVLPGVYVNGKLTMTENIADASGVKLAYAALKMVLPSSENKKVAGFTSHQQFYLTFSQAFCAKATDKFFEQFVNQNSHSPPRFRVNGMIVNAIDFPSAFSCPEGHCPMAPVNRCEVW